MDKKSNPKATLGVEKEKSLKQMEYLCKEEHKKEMIEILDKWVMNIECVDFKNLYDSIVDR